MEKAITILSMMGRFWTVSHRYCKPLFAALALLAAGCSTNPATGESQFTALMTPSQEEAAGAEQHMQIVARNGVLPAGDPVQAYVESVGRRISAGTERPEVSYRFFVLDMPAVNAFSLPGGYIYVTRGLLAQANDEAELAAVLAHETGHITARHAAARYSQGVLTSLVPVADLGFDLFAQSYSRAQESQADELGIRYLVHAGYDPGAMARFLLTLESHDDLQRRLDGRNRDGSDFFDTHPRTADRVAQAQEIAAHYPAAGETKRDEYLKAIDGLAWGDSDRQGYASGRTFWHPAMGFTFTVPDGFAIRNEPAQVVAKSPGGAVVILDSVRAPGEPGAYLRDKWMKGEKLSGETDITVGGRPAAVASFPGRVAGRPVTIRIAAIRWSADILFRFQIAIPDGAPPKLAADLDGMIESLRTMTDAEKRDGHPWRVRIVTAKESDTAASLAAQMPVEKMKEQQFRALNGIRPGEGTQPGRAYKLIAGN